MTEQDYPKLPLPMRINLTDGLPGRAVVEYYTADQMRDYADADRAMQASRHREELVAYEVTVGNLRAQVASDDVYISEILTREKNAAIADRQNYEVRVRLEADLEQLKAANLRAQLEQAQPVAHENCVPVACLVETDSGVMVWPIRNSAEACTYCDPDEIPQMLYLHPATPQAQPGHKPMTDGEKLYAMWHSSDANDLDDFLDGWRHAEAFHGITGDKP